MNSAMPGERTVHVVDDDADVRRSLERLLVSAGFTPVLYGSASALLARASELSHGCLLLDVRMPGMEGLDLQARLNDVGVSLPVIVMTAHGDVPTAVRAMKLGAIDFIEKPFNDEHLLASIETALVETGRAGRDREALEAAQRIALLSPRERQVLDGLVAGHSNKVIAYDLGISVRTAEVHRARMLERLGTRHTATAIRLAVMAALAPPSRRNSTLPIDASMRSEPPRRLISNVYDAALVPDLWPAALQAIMDALGAVGAGYGVFGKQTGRLEWLSQTGALVDMESDFLRYYHALDPYRPVLDAAPSGRWMWVSQCLPAAELRRNEWYNDYLLKIGVDDGLGVRLFESASHSVIFGLSHGIGRAPFAEAEIAALQELSEPLAKAARLHTELHSLGWRSSVAQRALDQLAAGVIVTDSEGRVIELNRVAERILRRGDGLMNRNGRLDALGVLDSGKLAKLIAAAADPTHAPAMGRMRIRRRKGRPEYILTVAPLGAELAAMERPLTMILVADPDELSPSEMDSAELFGMSPAESRLAAALLIGMKLSDMAATSGVRITTLRTQLSSILRKVGVERQADLVRVLSSIPGIGSSPSDPT
jgi:two-component system, LuxR family, response regulator FixJ